MTIYFKRNPCSVKGYLFILFLSSILYSKNITPLDSTNIIMHTYSAASKDSNCIVDIDYPEFQGLKEKYIQDTLNLFFKNEFVNEDEINISDCDPKFGSTLEINCYVEYNSKEVVSIVQYFYIYNGGAHGYYGHNGYNLDVRNGKMFSLDDLIKSSAFDELSKFSEKKLIEMYEVEEFIEIGFFEEKLVITETQDFYFTPNELVIEFDPYEIGPYVMGDIEIFLPWKEIKNLLDDDFYFMIN